MTSFWPGRMRRASVVGFAFCKEATRILYVRAMVAIVSPGATVWLRVVMGGGVERPMGFVGEDRMVSPGGSLGGEELTCRDCGPVSPRMMFEIVTPRPA